MQAFGDGLSPITQSIVDAVASGSLYMKIAKECIELLEIMVSNDYQFSFERGHEKKGVYELDTLNAIYVDNAALKQQVANLSKQLEKI